MTSLRAQENVTLSGYVRDGATGEHLIAATVYVKDNTSWASITNQYGFYSLSLPAGKHELVFQYLGFKDRMIQLELNENRRYNLELEPDVITTQEVVVSSERKDKNVSSADLGTVDLDVESIKSLPALMGEVDILKTLQLLPGVQSSGEGNSGFYVRGGGPDQNLILLDEAVVYNSGHLFGFFSVFNADAIKTTNLIKGGMPANYGSRLSSVVDVSMKDGNSKRVSASGGIGLISSRLTLEVPIIKDTSSLMISGRRTYIDALLKPFLKNTDFEGNAYYFYDLNMKFNYRLSDKDRIFLSSYFGRDVFNFSSGDDRFSVNIPWGNATTTARWNHLFTDKLFMNVSVIYNDYNFALNAGQGGFTFKLSSGIKDINEKIDFDYYWNVKHKLKFGLNHTYHTFIPNVATIVSEEDSIDIQPREDSKRFAHEWAAYLLDEFSVNDVLKINYGLRFSAYHQVGPYDYITSNAQNQEDTLSYNKGDHVATYTGLEPRLSMRYMINENTSMKGGVAYNKQYIHLVNNSSSSLPTDLWMPSTKMVRPQESIQYSIGIFKNFMKDELESSIELYYKDMQNQIEYADGYYPQLEQNIESFFVFGVGNSYGAEFFLKKRQGDFNGWIGYTWSKTFRTFDAINGGESFPTKFDRRHDLSVVLLYELSRRIRLGATFVYGTGNAMTLPVSRYFVEASVINEYGPRNGFRMEPYHRLDLSCTILPKFKQDRRYSGEWVISVYNVYNRMNPYFIYFENEGDILDGDLEIKAKQVSLFPIIPSIAWNFNF